MAHAESEEEDWAYLAANWPGCWKCGLPSDVAGRDRQVCANVRGWPLETCLRDADLAGGKLDNLTLATMLMDPELEIDEPVPFGPYIYEGWCVDCGPEWPDITTPLTDEQVAEVMQLRNDPASPSYRGDMK